MPRRCSFILSNRQKDSSLKITQTIAKFFSHLTLDVVVFSNFHEHCLPLLKKIYLPNMRTTQEFLEIITLAVTVGDIPTTNFHLNFIPYQNGMNGIAPEAFSTANWSFHLKFLKNSTPQASTFTQKFYELIFLSRFCHFIKSTHSIPI